MYPGEKIDMITTALKSLGMGFGPTSYNESHKDLIIQSNVAVMQELLEVKCTNQKKTSTSNEKGYQKLSSASHLCMQNILVVNINIHLFNISVEFFNIKLIVRNNVLINIYYKPEYTFYIKRHNLCIDVNIIIVTISKTVWY